MTGGADAGRSQPTDGRPILPSWTSGPDAAERVIRSIDEWTSFPELRRLIRAFPEVGEPQPQGESTLDALRDPDGSVRVAALDAFASRAFDFRGGRERNLLLPVSLGEDRDRLVLELAPALGLAGVERPRRRHYDALVMTGGMVRACIVKPRAAAELLGGVLSVGEVVFLGAHRAFAGDEHEVAAAIGRGIGPAIESDDEVAAMIAGMRNGFGLSTPDRHEGSGPPGSGSWSLDAWTSVDLALSVVAAPSSVPGERRANTADTFRHWAIGRAPGIRSVLVLTTPIYVPYQNAVAVEVLGLEHGLEVETIGTSAAASDLGALSQVFTPAHHLQELRAAIGSMASLRGAARRRGEAATR